MCWFFVCVFLLPLLLRAFPYSASPSPPAAAQLWSKRSAEEQWAIVSSLQARLKQRGGRVLQHLASANIGGAGSSAVAFSTPSLQARAPAAAVPQQQQHPQQRDEEAEAEENGASL